MRTRSIEPRFWRSSLLAELPRDFRLLWVGLQSYVDENGVGTDDYRQIAAELFALDDDPIEARSFVREGLTRFSRKSLITRYRFNGHPRFRINEWDDDQRIARPKAPLGLVPKSTREASDASQADPAHVREVLVDLGQELGWGTESELDTRRSALAIQCPNCLARPGAACTWRTSEGRFARMKHPHRSRVRAAEH
ncbi:zinc finger domain-containing protein [Saccharopolyspora shandongensis]|uniref:zinc finger domain-containing protein n=1 Tax=Saccharopolyspora shandongensis TaxID=418495 RepID=UPI0033FD14E3